MSFRALAEPQTGGAGKGSFDRPDDLIRRHRQLGPADMDNLEPSIAQAGVAA